MAVTLKQKTFHEEFAEITREIKRLELMKIENCREIERLHKDNEALDRTIVQLKAKRKQAVFLSVHIPDR